MNARQLVVTVSTSKSSKTQVWNPVQPLALGFPFKWVIEQTASGVRIRDLHASGMHLVTDQMLDQGSEVKLPSLTVKIKRALILKPAFQERTASNGKAELRAFACSGNWVTRSEPVNSKFDGFIHGKKAFSVYRKSDEYRLDFFIDGVTVKKGNPEAPESSPLKGQVGQALRFSREQLAASVILIDQMVWRFVAVNETVLPTHTASEIDPDSAWFKLTLRTAVLGLGAFMIASFLWPTPKPNTEELVPAQYTKLVMPTKPVAPAQSQPAGAPEQHVGTKVAKQVEKSAVVQAFRAKALRSAVSGLLKGGMSTLLAQSDFVAGKEATSNARKIFDSKDDALRATGQEVGNMNAKNVTVATLGGEGAGANGAKGVGYGKGEHAAVKGQGKSMVSLDIGASSVEEGLTKDEVGEVIHRHLSEVRYCYESAILRQPDVEGKLVVSFTIGGPGSVKGASVKQSTLPDPRLDDCILRRLMTWKFPNTKGGIDVGVTYPFIFKTLGR